MQKKQIETIINNLPPLPESLDTINNYLMNPEDFYIPLRKIIEEDALLSAHIIQTINSPLYGLPNTINNVQRAIALLGMSTVSGIALQIIVKDMFNLNLSPYNMSEQDFINLSINQTKLAKKICIDEYEYTAKEVIPTSFLLEIGKAVSSQVILDSKQDLAFIEAIQNNPFDLPNIERTFIGMSSYDITALIFKHLNINDEIIENIVNLDTNSYKASKLLYTLSLSFDNKGYTSKERVDYVLDFARKNNLNEKIFHEALQSFL